MLKVEKLNENQKTKNKKLPTKNKGITLIALVITIIVILILAGVSINTLFGDNGLLTKTNDARVANDKARIYDMVATEVLASYGKDGQIDKEQLLSNLKRMQGVTVTGLPDSVEGMEFAEGNPLVFYVVGYKVTVELDGTVTVEGLGGENPNTPQVNDKPTIPTGYTVSKETDEDDVSEGLVIKNDTTSDEFVWIEVPKEIYKNETYNTTGHEITAENTEDIEKVLKTYSSAYGTSKDTFYGGCGFEDKDKYNEAKNKMLKSVYENGGFWIGRYEAGIEGKLKSEVPDAPDTAAHPRTKHTDVDITDPNTPKAVSQPNKYPYNYVYCSEAQKLASEMSTSGELTSSLMFGVQWNLVCKFLETKNALEQSKINGDSTTWGNYSKASFTVNSGEYTTDPSSGSWTKCNGETKNGHWLLTTGASTIDETTPEGKDRNCILNIYDFAGNESEWTLDGYYDYAPCRCRGGYYNSAKGPVSDSSDFLTSSSSSAYSFRVTLY